MCQNVKQNILIIAQDALDSTVAVIKVVDPTWSGLANLQTDGAAVITAIENWTPGTPAQDAVEALDLLLSNITLFSQIPGLSQKYVAIIIIAIDGVKSAIMIIEEHSSGTTQQAAQMAMSKTTWTQPTHVYEGGRQYAVDWNHAIRPYPELAVAKMPVPKKWGILP